MINCDVLGLGQLCSGLRLETYQAKQYAYGRSEWDSHGGEGLTDDTRKRMGFLLQLASGVAETFEWKAVADRVARFEHQLNDPKLNVFGWHQELKALMEAVEDGLKGQFLYRYPDQSARVLSNWKDDWSAVLESFPQAKADIVAGVDLWALSHPTASVFQFMRVLEFGLRALAADVGKSFDVQNWQNIIEEIEAAIRQLGKTLPRGMAKTERLQFLSEAAKEFVYFKDGWRNYVSHGRGNYDVHEARSIMDHVRTFMTVLGANLRTP